MRLSEVKPINFALHSFLSDNVVVFVSVAMVNIQETNDLLLSVYLWQNDDRGNLRNDACSDIAFRYFLIRKVDQCNLRTTEINIWTRSTTLEVWSFKLVFFT